MAPVRSLLLALALLPLGAHAQSAVPDVPDGDRTGEEAPSQEQGLAQAPAGAATVQMTEQRRFTPEVVRIAPGQTVVWQNGSTEQHTVTFAPEEEAGGGNPSEAAPPPTSESFDSGPVEPGASFSHTFQAPGTYRYVCTNHEQQRMVGVVEVVPQ